MWAIKIRDLHNQAKSQATKPQSGLLVLLNSFALHSAICLQIEDMWIALWMVQIDNLFARRKVMPQGEVPRREEGGPQQGLDGPASHGSNLV